MGVVTTGAGVDTGADVGAKALSRAMRRSCCASRRIPSSQAGLCRQAAGAYARSWAVVPAVSHGIRCSMACDAQPAMRSPHQPRWVGDLHPKLGPCCQRARTFCDVRPDALRTQSWSAYSCTGEAEEHLGATGTAVRVGVLVGTRTGAWVGAGELGFLVGVLCGAGLVTSGKPVSFAHHLSPI